MKYRNLMKQPKCLLRETDEYRRTIFPIVCRWRPIGIRAGRTVAVFLKGFSFISELRRPIKEKVGHPVELTR